MHKYVHIICRYTCEYTCIYTLHLHIHIYVIHVCTRTCSRLAGRKMTAFWIVCVTFADMIFYFPVLVLGLSRQGNAKAHGEHVYTCTHTCLQPEHLYRYPLLYRYLHLYLYLCLYICIHAALKAQKHRFCRPAKGVRTCSFCQITVLIRLRVSMFGIVVGGSEVSWGRMLGPVFPNAPRKAIRSISFRTLSWGSGWTISDYLRQPISRLLCAWPQNDY